MISPGIKAAPKMCSIKPYYSISFPGIKAASPKCVQLNPITLLVLPGIKAAPKMCSIKPYYSISFPWH